MRTTGAMVVGIAIAIALTLTLGGTAMASIVVPWILGRVVG